MSKCIAHEACPRCIKEGRDRRGDNLGVWADGSRYCFSCGYYRPAKYLVRNLKETKDDVKNEESVLPRDFTREIPAEGWKWLLQYGLSYSYWKPYCGYSPSKERLVITFGNPIRFSQGRYLGNDERERSRRKWCFWGDGHGYVEILGAEKKGACVLVEDIISAHKVAQVAPCICLFGTNVHDVAVKELLRFKRPVKLWLDNDQGGLLAKKINRLQTFINHPVSHVITEKDPKVYSFDEIKEILK